MLFDVLTPVIPSLYALVILGVDLPHSSVPVKNLVLEINGQNRNTRHDQHDDQSQLPIEQKHITNTLIT